jgi:uncharacterized membrane protein HdeD (DUF308 family)
MATISFAISGVLAIIAGLLVLVFPKLVRVVLGLYLLIWGILQVAGPYI